MNEDEQLQELCVKLGSSPGQAATMAAQLSKRATQLAGQRGWSRETALQHLLNLVVQAAAARCRRGFLPPIPDSNRKWTRINANPDL